MSNAFNAREILKIHPDRLFRVYVSEHSLVFVRIGGQSGLAFSLETQLGLRKVAARLRDRERSRLMARALEADSYSHDYLLTRHKHNKAVPLAEVVVAHIRPPKALAHGYCVAIWELALRNGGSMKLQFEWPEDLTEAVELLGGALGDRLVVQDEHDGVTSA